MEDERKLSRRNFLRLSAVTAASAMLVACGGGGAGTQGGATAGAGAEATTGGAEGGAGGAGAGTAETATTGAEGGAGGAGGGAGAGATETATTGAGGGGGAGAAETATASGATGGEPAASGATTAPIAAPGNYKESPMLAQMVQGGQLPPVAERLPKEPYVPPHGWLQTGKYGGFITMTSGANFDGIMAESMKGHSIINFLKDGTEIGPGWVTSWESNADTSQWTLHMRQGIKWSDGKPFTTRDVMYWWEDLVLNEDHPATAPDEAISAKGTVMTLEAPDDFTLVMNFDSPAVLTPDRLAMWVNGQIGPRWVVPRHYAEQFHPKYNPNVQSTATTAWHSEHDNKINYAKEPACPTLNGWRVMQYEEGVRGRYERNPYYWVVDKEGNQLPYLDGWNVTAFQDVNVQKLAIIEGRTDWEWFTPVGLVDVQALKQNAGRNQLDVRLWDTGSGTGSIMFFNYDYIDDKYREIIRKPEFRKAISHAFRRDEVRRSVYFNQGEATTGTMSPKAIEYIINDEGKQVYASWRDSAVKYDVNLARQLLQQAGLKESGGKWTFADGSPFQITLDMPADTTGEHLNKNQLLLRDLVAIGLDAKLNPIPSAAYEDGWKQGRVMTKTTWEVGDGPNHLLYPQWVVPLEDTRWAPLQGKFNIEYRNTPKANEEADKRPWDRQPPRAAPEEGGPVARLLQIYDQTKLEPDAMKRHRMVWDMIKIHVAEGPFYMGSVANPPRLALVKQGLMNVPQRDDLHLKGFGNPWIHPTPAVYDPETWFWDNPDQHKG